MVLKLVLFVSNIFQLYNDPGDGFLLVLVCFASVNMGEADLR